MTQRLTPATALLLSVPPLMWAGNTVVGRLVRDDMPPITLIANAGRVLTHPHLLRQVWGPSRSQSTHYLRVYMGNLRQKLEDDSAQPRHILTETGVGYRLMAD